MPREPDTAAVPPFGVLPFCAGSVACGGLFRVTDAKTHLILDVTNYFSIARGVCQSRRRGGGAFEPDSLVKREGIE